MSWTKDGTLADGSTLAAAWRRSPAELEEARMRGEVFALWLQGKAWYPAKASQIESAIFASINGTLGNASPVSRLFFLHQHGALQERPPAQALDAGMNAHVLRIAEVWSTS